MVITHSIITSFANVHSLYIYLLVFLPHLPCLNPPFFLPVKHPYWSEFPLSLTLSFFFFFLTSTYSPFLIHPSNTPPNLCTTRYASSPSLFNLPTSLPFLLLVTTTSSVSTSLPFWTSRCSRPLLVFSHSADSINSSLVLVQDFRISSYPLEICLVPSHIASFPISTSDPDTPLSHLFITRHAIMAPKLNSHDFDGSESAPPKPPSDDTPSGTPDPTQVHSAVHSQLRSRSSSRGLGEIGRSAHFSRLLRRQRPRPAPLNVSQPANEPVPLTAVENSPPPPPPTPLLAGCPGREISGATCNGREWACDFDKPPVLIHPHDLSKTAFHEHPLAQHIMLEKGWEMEQLALFGLILPEKLDNGSPTYTWDSDSGEDEDPNKGSMFDREAKTPLKLPAAPERSRTPSNILHKVKSFANFIANSDLEKDVPELPELPERIDQFGLPPGVPTEPTSRTFIRPARSSSSLRPMASVRTVPSATMLRKKRSAGIDKSQISHPVVPEEKRRVGSDSSQALARRTGTAESERDSSFAGSVRSPLNLVSPSMSTKLPLYLLQPQHPTVYFGKNQAPPKFRLAPPRLSPMEYARQYFLAKTKAEKENAECTVSKPILIWVWTEDYREFLLLPRIPKGIQRNFLPSNDKDWKKSDFLRPYSDLYTKGIEECLLTPLSLDLAPSSPLLPACFLGSLHSPGSSTHKRSMSLGSFTIDQPVVTESQKSPLQSTKLLLSDPSASILGEHTDLFAGTSSKGSIPMNSVVSQLSSGPSLQQTITAAPRRDEYNVSPKDPSDEELPLAPVSPLSSSPASAQTKQPKASPPPQTTKSPTLPLNSLDDGQTQHPTEQTYSQAISDGGADLADTSSVYSQDSVITVVHHPVAKGNHIPPSSMLHACLASETGQTPVGPGQQQNVSSNSIHPKGRTFQQSPTLLPLSYIPNTQSAYSHATSEQPQDLQVDDQSQAPSSITSAVPTWATNSTVCQRDRHSTVSNTSLISQSFTSTSAASRCSQTPVSATNPLPGHFSASKHGCGSRIERTTPKAPFNITYQSSNTSRLPILTSVSESPCSSPTLQLSVTSPSTCIPGQLQQKNLPKQPDSSEEDTVKEAIESRNSDLPPLQVRRRRAVKHLPYIPVSQIYPQPLRINAMKSPNPASAMSSGDSSGAAADSSTGTVNRSTSSLIMDVNAEVDREMEEVLSPRTTALVAASDSVKEREKFDTPTRRAPHKPRSFPKPVPWSPPIYPPPNKPLPPIPQKKKAPSETPVRTFIDVDCGPGPAVSRAPTLSHTTTLSRAKAASLAPVITQAPGPARPPAPIPTPTSEFYDPYPPPKVIWTNGDVTVSDFSIPKRIVRPAASLTAIAPRPPSLMDRRQQQVRGQDSAVNVNKPESAAAPAVITSPVPSRSRFLGKMASMTDMKNRKETVSGYTSGSGSGSGSDDAIGMRTFLGEDHASASTLAEDQTQRSEKSAEGRKKKFFESLFRRNRKTGEK
ncbi:hypothetical protein CTA2_6597 [Colletotrichum tanaceti]|uniref:Uncharacterized protein n=1 Tax=Colletotrichum tanaceti TaxID=1306861 RepID=A0A4U6XIX0_9PEZI|nr:hypothetical protein CTA2_6597 [Colletotrichum tanaceti]TKW55761.1 hypothetical protein CTA1_180 [Colletotrichum tanaceti]